MSKKRKNCLGEHFLWDLYEDDPHPYEFWEYETERIPIEGREDCPGGRILRRLGRKSGISTPKTRKELAKNGRRRTRRKPS